MSRPEVDTVPARSQADPPLVGSAEPIDLDEMIQRRADVIAAWIEWDDAPGNAHKANAFVDACIAYAGRSNVAFAKFIAAVRRGGGDRESALQAWESDW
jgi:hypothetical protein